MLRSLLSILGVCPSILVFIFWICSKLLNLFDMFQIMFYMVSVFMTLCFRVISELFLNIFRIVMTCCRLQGPRRTCTTWSCWSSRARSRSRSCSHGPSSSAGTCHLCLQLLHSQPPPPMSSLSRTSTPAQTNQPPATWTARLPPLPAPPWLSPVTTDAVGKLELRRSPRKGGW